MTRLHLDEKTVNKSWRLRIAIALAHSELSYQGFASSNNLERSAANVMDEPDAELNASRPNPPPQQVQRISLDPPSQPFERLSLDTTRTSVNTKVLGPSTDNASNSSTATNAECQSSSPKNAQASSRSLSLAAPASPGSPRLHRKSSSPVISKKEGQNTKAHPAPRRVSSYASSLRTAVADAPHPTPAPEEAPLTAAKIAADHFKNELKGHEIHKGAAADAIVIIHDSCYGHRYSRPRTSKATLNFIVERPERIQASVLGVSAAYVRLGQRHSEGANPPSPHANVPLPIPFRIQKSSRSVSLNEPIVTNVHGTKWMQELNLMCEAADSKLKSGNKELSRPTTPTIGAGADLKPSLHEGDLYLCGESLTAFQSAIGGVCDGVDAVFQINTNVKPSKRAFVCVRPPGHHCSSELPSGFCWLNNVHVGIEYATQRYGLTHAAIIDFDLHHGDGSQAITWEKNMKNVKVTKTSTKGSAQPKKAGIGYFSLHDINSYPCEYGDSDKIQAASVCLENAHDQTIWNVHLQPWTTEDEFWKIYEKQYMTILKKAEEYLQRQTQKVKSMNPSTEPQGAIFVSAGFDASQWEMETMQRHKVNVPTEFYARFTSDVLRVADNRETTVEGRVISVLEGGYSDRALTSGVLSHISGLTSRQKPRNSTFQAPPLSDDMSPNGLSRTWDPAWWAEDALIALESMKAPSAPPPPLPKKARNTEIPTYTTPTQSFTAKVVDPSKVYRSTSGTIQAPDMSRGPTPSTPQVDWATSAYELGKLLIPNGRQISSCKHEDLNGPRVKKERHSSIGLPGQPPPDRQLRGRKTPNSGDGTADFRGSTTSITDDTRSFDRRRTISDLPLASVTEHGEANEAHRSNDASTTPIGSARNIPPVKKPSAVNRQPPLSRAPAPGIKGVRGRRGSGPKDNIASSMKSANKSGQSASFAQESAQENKPKTEHCDSTKKDADGVDALASQVKKITLKMPEENTEAEKADIASVSREQTVPRASRAARPMQTAAAPAKGRKGVKPDDTTKCLNATTYGNPSQATRPSRPSAKSNLTEQVDLRVVKAQESNTTGSNARFQEVPSAKSGAGSITPIVSDKSRETSRTTDQLDDFSTQGSRMQADASLAQGTRENMPQEPFAPEFIHYEPANDHHLIPSSFTASISGPWTWLEPNTRTPKKEAQDQDNKRVPVFNAQGSIPFFNDAASGNAEQTPASEARSEGSVVRTSSVTQPAQTGGGLTGQSSIWEVPVTPQK